MKEMHISEIWSILKTSHGNAILLKPKNMEVAVPIFIGTLELQSILIGKEGANHSRPHTHDLFLNMLSHVNLSIKKIEVFELKDDVFHARLIVTGGEYTKEKPLILDSRPSDAFAIATRKKSPIYIASSVIEETGVPLSFFINELAASAEAGSEEYSTDNASAYASVYTGDKHRHLRKQLEQAIAEEEYEQAAEIRDLLKLLDAE